MIHNPLCNQRCLTKEMAMHKSTSTFLAIAIFLIIATGAALGHAQTVYVEPTTSQPEENVFTLDIVLDTEGQEVMGLEISISFNELIVHLDGIDPGPWFTDLGHEWFFWDYTHPETELIHFTGSSLGSGVTTSGVVATCRFTALQPGISPLDFLGVDIRDPHNTRLIADHSSGDSIIIDAAVSTEDLSLDFIKALYK